MFCRIEEQSLIHCGKKYSLPELKQLIDNEKGDIKSTLLDLYNFLEHWFNESTTITVQTSGSTGTPKKIQVDKDKMIQSALSTCNYLNLKPGNTALLCLPLQYIAGMMMVVRALVAGLDLQIIPPTGHPLSQINDDIDFCAMIPMQVYNSLNNPTEKIKLARVKTLIIGGSAIDDILEKSLEDFSNKIYSTYGMTETLSHIALRELNGDSNNTHYKTLPTVNISLSNNSTLVIDAPWSIYSPLITNDIATIHTDGSFSILGRLDNVINCGGVKLHIEEIEKHLSLSINIPFAITSRPHPKWGEEIVLLVQESSSNINWLKQVIEQLPKYWQPHFILTVSCIPLTNTSKIDRKRCKEIALEQIKTDYPKNIE